MKTNIFSLEVRTAVIIGGSGELCGAIAEGDAEAGANVVLVGRDSDKAGHELVVDGGYSAMTI